MRPNHTTRRRMGAALVTLLALTAGACSKTLEDYTEEELNSGMPLHKKTCLELEAGIHPEDTDEWAIQVDNVRIGIQPSMRAAADAIRYSAVRSCPDELETNMALREFLRGHGVDPT